MPRFFLCGRYGDNARVTPPAYRAHAKTRTRQSRAGRSGSRYTGGLPSVAGWLDGLGSNQDGLGEQPSALPNLPPSNRHATACSSADSANCGRSVAIFALDGQFVAPFMHAVVRLALAPPNGLRHRLASKWQSLGRRRRLGILPCGRAYGGIRNTKCQVQARRSCPSGCSCTIPCNMIGQDVEEGRICRNRDAESIRHAPSGKIQSSDCRRGFARQCCCAA